VTLGKQGPLGTLFNIGVGSKLIKQRNTTFRLCLCRQRAWEVEDGKHRDSTEREEGEGRGRESRLLATAKSVSTASVQEDGIPS
jgi:hypothetical protein